MARETHVFHEPFIWDFPASRVWGTFLFENPWGILGPAPCVGSHQEKVWFRPRHTTTGYHPVGLCLISILIMLYYDILCMYHFMMSSRYVSLFYILRWYCWYPFGCPLTPRKCHILLLVYRWQVSAHHQGGSRCDSGRRCMHFLGINSDARKRPRRI